MTTVKSIDDSIISFYAFKFTSHDKKFKVKNEYSYLIDIFFEELIRISIVYLFVIVFSFSFLH